MEKYVQTSVFGVSSERLGEFNLYHDESGIDLAHERFQLHGILIIPQNKLTLLFNSLFIARNGYPGQVHFVDLRDNTSSQMKTVAYAWLNLFFNEMIGYCSYKCLVVDTQAKYIEQFRKPNTYYLYNLSAKIAISGAIAWSLSNYDSVNLSIFSENRSRSRNDNFIEYIPREILKKTGKNFPKIIIPDNEVILVNGNPQRVIQEDRNHCEFIQLTDLITGAIRQAIVLSAGQKIKVDLGKLVSGWIIDSRLPPWLQIKDIHRKFSVSCFPGFYDVPLEVSNINQQNFGIF